MGKKKAAKSSSGKSSKNKQNDRRKGNSDDLSSKSHTKREARKFNHADEDDQFRKELQADNLEIADMAADGNCLFRSLSDQLYGDYGKMHEEIRSDICDYMEKNKEDFQLFLVLDDDSCEEGDDAKDFESYIQTMRGDAEWGGNLELVAAARLYERKVTVFSAALSAYSIEPNIKPTGPDLLVSFHDNDHYNSVRNTNGPPRAPSRRSETKAKEKKDKKASEKEESDSTGTSGTAASSSTEVSSGLSDRIAGVQKPGNKRGPCPCGSGKRYKKCCASKEKHAARLAKSTTANSSDDGDTGGGGGGENSADTENPETIGNFHVLKI